MLIQNHCKILPDGVIWHIETSLKHIPIYDLFGIDCICLMDENNISIWEKGVADFYANAKENNTTIIGAYQRKRKTQPAIVYLFIKNLYYPIPSAVWWSPVPILHIGKIIAHEVGHHLIATRGYVFEPTEKYSSEPYEEEMVNRYSFNIIQKMKRKIIYKFGNALMTHVVNVYFELGSNSWKQEDYERAAEYWYRCFLLDSERQDVIEWYWRAKDKLKSFTPQTENFKFS